MIMKKTLEQRLTFRRQDTSYNDIFDAFRLANFYHFKKGVASSTNQ
jgi:hypothetical protein